MRRFVANALLLVTLGVFLAPVITAATTPSIPACCRRGGAHHCAMMAEMMLQTDGKAVRCNNPCPMRQAPQLGSSIAALVVSRSVQIALRAQSITFSAYSAPEFLRTLVNRERGPPQRIFA